ncbi:MAG: type III polyketide synthase [Actinomycetota bacterium]|nr:type III polyketide synthase [Actinomycetota bacterium]
MPTPFDHQSLWDEHFAERYPASPLAARLWQTVGVKTRHAVIDPRVEDVSSWPTSRRMTRFTDEVGPLGRAAVERALRDAGVAAAQVGLFAVVSCTGFGAPGPDVTLARDLGMDPGVRRLAINGMGCYAALPALASAADFVRAQGKVAVVLCVELTSLHAQPPEPADIEQLVAHALFADAAAAVVLTPNAAGLQVVDVAAAVAPDTTNEMTWAITDTGFRMRLSAGVPDVLAHQVGPLVERLLADQQLNPADVKHWAIHPGGPRILDAAVQALDLADSAVDVSRRVLERFGNCSSATVLLVLDELRNTRPLQDGEHVIAMTFGPGLTIYAALLRHGAPV